jgi:hypothetical protein
MAKKPKPKDDNLNAPQPCHFPTEAEMAAQKQRDEEALRNVVADMARNGRDDFLIALKMNHGIDLGRAEMYWISKGRDAQKAWDDICQFSQTCFDLENGVDRWHKHLFECGIDHESTAYQTTVGEKIGCDLRKLVIPPCPGCCYSVPMSRGGGWQNLYTPEQALNMARQSIPPIFQFVLEQLGKPYEAVSDARNADWNEKLGPFIRQQHDVLIEDRKVLTKQQHNALINKALEESRRLGLKNRKGATIDREAIRHHPDILEYMPQSKKTGRRD